MVFNVLTLFPGLFQGFLTETLLKRSREAGVVTVNLVDIRDYATDKHKTTDDTPYGGGPGMVMKIEPLYRALGVIQGQTAGPGTTLGTGRSRRQQIGGGRTVLLSPRGKLFDQRVAEKYATLESLTLLCGRYEGVDQRVADHLVDEECAIGPYVLSGGEVAAMVVIEAVARLLPGFLGNPESLKEESFSAGMRNEGDGKRDQRRERPHHSPLTPHPSVEYPQYTKPEEFRGWTVPPVLLSGDHKKITAWRNARRRRTLGEEQ